MTAGAGVTTEAGNKMTLQHEALAACVVAYDPEVLAGVPDHVLVTTGFNGIAHCAEGLYTGVGTALSAGWATLGAQALAEGLRDLTADRRDSAVYEQLGAGAALGGLVVRHAGTALHHAICHELGGFLGVPHGVANAVMLTHVLRFNLPETRRVQSVLAQALGDRALDLPDAVDRLSEEIGAPRRLRDVGIRRDELAAVAERVMSRPGLAVNPRPVVAADQVHGILESAW